MAGTVRLTLVIEEVGDPAPVPRGISVAIVVTVDDARVQAGFSGVLNHWPDVLSMQAVIDAQSAGGQVVPGQRARVDAAARDVDNDSLTATFSADARALFDREAAAPFLFRRCTARARRCTSRQRRSRVDVLPGHARGRRRTAARRAPTS
jgi:hypothetical protein